MTHPDTYMGHLLAGRDPGDIDEWVERWHEGPARTTLPDFLGMTEEEYANWVAAPAALEHIVAIRRMVEEARTAVTAEFTKDTGRLN